MMCGSTGKGKIEYASIDHVFEKMDHKDTFLLLISKESCIHCKALKEMLEDTLKKQDVVLYTVQLDESSEEATQKDKDRLRERFEDADLTPHVFYIEKGEVKDDLLGYQENHPEYFWDWVNNLPKSS